MTAAERMDLLLPWLNVNYNAEETEAERNADYVRRFPTREVRHRLRRFVDAFDGDGESGWVRVGKVDWRPSAWRTPFRIPALPKAEQSDSEEMVHEWLRLILREWLLAGTDRDAVPRMFNVRGPVPTPTLRFGVDGAHGTNTLVIEGAFPDVVIFLVANLLATSVVEVKTCLAPAPGESGKPNDWTRRCGNFFVSKGIGRPRLGCDGCRPRRYAERESRKRKPKQERKRR